MAPAGVVISGEEYSIVGGQILYKFSVFCGWPKIRLTDGKRRAEGGEPDAFDKLTTSKRIARVYVAKDV
jgi:hypothetical protein